MDPSTTKTMEEYDSIQLTIVGTSGIERTLTVPVQTFKEQVAKDGCFKFTSDGLPEDPELSLLYDESLVGDAKIDLSTLGPRPWLEEGNQRFGGVMCEMSSSTNSDFISARSSAKRLLQRLKEDHGFLLKSAFEAEFMVFEEDEVTTLNNCHVVHYCRIDNMVGKENDLLQAPFDLQKAGVPVETFMSELAIGQFEITFRPEKGVASADSVVIMKQGLRIDFAKGGMVPTFMTLPATDGHANGFHFNHSLWTDDGQNAFLDANDPLLMSDAARHWIAGLIYHAPALTPLVCPTVNCYGRLQDEFTPDVGSWSVEKDTTYLRVKNEKGNVYVENRLPSGACNPYLTVAAMVAAGLDGLTRRLECPPRYATDAPVIPKDFGEALECLEKDAVLVESIGRGLISKFVTLCKKGIQAQKDGIHSSVDQERRMYLKRI